MVVFSNSGSIETMAIEGLQSHNSVVGEWKEPTRCILLSFEG
jgi:hypothetical protein